MRRLAWISLFFSACSAPNTLEGSLSDQAPLAFDTVTLQRSDTALALAFTRNPSGGGGVDIVLKLSAMTKGANLDGEVTLDLAELVDQVPRGAASRAVAGDSRREFPPVKRGTLHFEAAPAIGASVTGDFSVLFDQGGAIGAGRTVFGTFEATVAEAGK